VNSQLLANSVIKLLRKNGLTLSVAESVTAGGLASELTKIVGSSQVFLGGVIAYSDEVKISELKISKSEITRHTAVSEEIAIAMAQAVRLKLMTDYAISTTGVAGPDRAYGQKVGTAWVGLSSKKESFAVALAFSGDRESIRHAIITSALAALERTLTP
jgi:nicotinamide-nucleotide amidase